MAAAAIGSNSNSGKSTVRFSDLHEVPYGLLSPLSPHPISVRHRRYASVNHFFQAQRFAGSAVEEAVARAHSLWELDAVVRRAEEARPPQQVEDWDNIKPDIMLLGCYYKFKQNSDASAVLLQTNNKVIVYHNENGFWGDGGDGTGKNLLGIILMAVRKRLAAEERATKRTGGGTRRRGAADDA